MITLHWYSQTFMSEYAVRGGDYVALYDDSFSEVRRIVNIYGQEWEHISIEGGEWSDPEDIPSENEVLRADMDFLTMENEYLEQVNEQQQADIDFCLMLLEE